jgi:hypothetical protein
VSRNEVFYEMFRYLTADDLASELERVVKLFEKVKRTINYRGDF